MIVVAASFAERFELIERSSAGLALDAQTGAFYRLNDSALAICRMLAATGSRDATIDRVASTYAIDRAAAACAVDDVLGLVASEDAARGTNNLVRFEASSGSLEMHWDGSPVVRIAGDLRVTWIANDRCTPAEALLWTAPHLLVLSDVTVLHASAVARVGAVTCLVGASGTGKTTTAAALVAAGGVSVSEDLVVIRAAPNGAEVLRDAEAAIRAWVAGHAGALGAGERIDGASLRSMLPTAVLPLGEIGFLERRHRGDSIIASPIDEIDGMVRLLENSFAEVGSSEIFRRVFRHADALSRHVRFATWSAPDGLDALTHAIRQLQ